IVEPIPLGRPARDYLEQNVNKTLIKALTALCKEKPKDPVLWLADKLIEINPYKPKVNKMDLNLNFDESHSSSVK
ncbi:unnamed protein product, partial [Didymodactylos carnosus]